MQLRRLHVHATLIRSHALGVLRPSPADVLRFDTSALPAGGGARSSAVTGAIARPWQFSGARFFASHARHTAMTARARNFDCIAPGSTVLSIQSHTVTGYCGNRCAVFPLQLLGLEVNAINSVQFSNHSAYPIVKGQRLDGKDLGDLVDGLEANGLLYHDYLLTGYIGTAGMLKAVAEVVERLRAQNGNLHYGAVPRWSGPPSLIRVPARHGAAALNEVPGGTEALSLQVALLAVCDPVLGDKGRLYLPEELVPLYRDMVLPLADMVTPNAFEAQLLSGVTVRNQDDALRACAALHDLGPSTVPAAAGTWEAQVITSLEGGEPAAPVVIVASTRVPQESGLPQRFKLELPRLDIPDFAGPAQLHVYGDTVHRESGPGQAPTAGERVAGRDHGGAGDLMTALLLGWSHRRPGQLQHAVMAAAASLQAVLQATTAAAGPAALQTERTAEVLKQRELRLVSCQESIRNPPLSLFDAKLQSLA